MPPNWDNIERCRIVKVLGVTECNYCPTHDECWGEESNLDKVFEAEGRE